jgi:hypothetical protein
MALTHGLLEHGEHAGVETGRTRFARAQFAGNGIGGLEGEARDVVHEAIRMGLQRSGRTSPIAAVDGG